MRRRFRGADALAIGQGAYDLVAGVWPLVHLDSFLAATGPKTDLWLVRAVGAVVTAVGATLLLGGLRRSTSLELSLLGAGSTLGLAAMDLV